MRFSCEVQAAAASRGSNRLSPQTEILRVFTVLRNVELMPNAETEQKTVFRALEWAGENVGGPHANVTAYG